MEFAPRLDSENDDADDDNHEKISDDILIVNPPASAGASPPASAGQRPLREAIAENTYGRQCTSRPAAWKMV